MAATVVIDRGHWIVGVDGTTIAQNVYMPPYESAPLRPYTVHVLNATFTVTLYPNGDAALGEDARPDGSPAVTVNGAASVSLTAGVWLVYRYCPDPAAARDWKAVQIV